MEDLSHALAVGAQGFSQGAKLLAGGSLDLRQEVALHLGKPVRGGQFGLQVADAVLALAHLDQELRDVGGLGHHRRVPLLLGTKLGELLLGGAGVRGRGQLALHLRFHLGDHPRHHGLGEHAGVQEIDQCAVHLVDGLVEGDRADGVAPFVMEGAGVSADPPLASFGVHHPDGSAASSALGDAGERVLGLRAARVRLGVCSTLELGLDRAPGDLVHDAPLGDLYSDDVLGIGGHSYPLPPALDPVLHAVDVDPAVSLAAQDLPDRHGRPGARSPPPSGGGGDTPLVERDGHPMQAPALPEGVEHPAHELGLCFIDDRGGELAPAGVLLPDVPVAEAGAAGDSSGSDALAERLAGPRADGLELHLRAHALNEGHGRVDGALEGHFLAGAVIEESSPAIADELPDGHRRIDRVPTEAEVVSADNEVAGCYVGQQLVQGRPAGEVVAGDAVIDVVLRALPEDGWLSMTKSLSETERAVALGIDAELLPFLLGPT